MTAPATPHIPVTSSVVAPWNPRIGERCVVTSTKDWASDWADPAGRPLQLWVAGVVAMAGGGVNVTVSDEWPIKARPFYQGGGTDLTDGFIVGVDGEQDDLAPLDAPEAADIITALTEAGDALVGIMERNTDDLDTAILVANTSGDLKPDCLVKVEPWWDALQSMKAAVASARGEQVLP